MRIGVPKEIKPQEFRVGLTPAGVRELTTAGHEVYVETQAGAGIGLNNDAYVKAGAKICEDAEALYSSSKLIVKVKEPQAAECQLLTEKHILFAYLHLAPDPQQANLLMTSGASCIAYETIAINGQLPLLAPMSEVAGRLSVQAAARCLEKSVGGAGILLGGAVGVPPASVTIIGGGVVGLNAARMAMGLGADVTIVDKSLARLTQIDELFGPRISTLYSTREAIENQLRKADAVIGAVLVAGAKAPKLVSRNDLTIMKTGSVLVDVAIDQGGCFETSKPTTHNNPTYIIDGIVHYCVANMPGAVAKTATFALTNATLPYVLSLANEGLQSLKEKPGFMAGLNVASGKICHPVVAEALGKTYFAAESVLIKPSAS